MRIIRALMGIILGMIFEMLVIIILIFISPSFSILSMDYFYLFLSVPPTLGFIIGLSISEFKGSPTL